MSARRRPLHRDDLNIETTLRRAVDTAPAIELGWSLLRHDMADAGWPASTPDDDRLPPPQPTTQCVICNEQFTTTDGVNTHRDETGHDDYTAVDSGQEPPSGIDYADPSGELALQFNRMTGDLETLQTHWHLVCTSLRAITAIASRYIPPATPAIPACSVTTCDDHVEFTPSGGYRGMELIVGHWVAKPGTRPVCAKHRKSDSRVPRENQPLSR